MKERPILFSAPMVRAILDGRKTQTRRVVKHAPAPWNPEHHAWEMTNCPYGHPGDRLWVRETFSYWLRNSDRLPDESDYEEPWYRADADAYGLLGRDEYGPVYTEQLLWKPSIYMPRAASRILLEVVSVRVERLQEISGSDCLAEGIDAAKAPDYVFGYHEAYRDLWESINGPGSWSGNPWVWVVEFKRVAA